MMPAGNGGTAEIIRENLFTSLPVNLMSGTALAVHLVPFSAFGLAPKIDLNDLFERRYNIAPLGRDRPSDADINFDGILAVANWEPDKPHASYLQIYRNGVAESLAHIESPRPDKSYLHAARIEKYCVKAVFQWTQILSQCGFEPPYAVLASILDTSGRIMLAGKEGFQDYSKKIVPPALHFAEAIVERLATDIGEQAQLLKKPLIEQIWNTLGLASPPTFDENGVWHPAPIS
jgi:hypothetical protein